MDEKICMVYITASSKEEAGKIADTILSKRLAACCNIYDGVRSLYWWKDKIEEDQETTIMVKTREALLPELEKSVKEVHSYSCPCIIALPIMYASEKYKNWIIEVTK